MLHTVYIFIKSSSKVVLVPQTAITILIEDTSQPSSCYIYHISSSENILLRRKITFPALGPSEHPLCFSITDTCTSDLSDKLFGSENMMEMQNCVTTTSTDVPLNRLTVTTGYPVQQDHLTSLS